MSTLPYKRGRSGALAYKGGRYFRYLLPLGILGALTWMSSRVCHTDWTSLGRGIAESLPYFKHLLTPDWSACASLLKPALDTVLIALVGTFAGTLISIFFALSAASNVAPPAVRFIVRAFMGTERAIPEIIILLFMVASFGIGPFSGVLSLTIGCVGMLGKLLADAIEELDPVYIESMEAVGARKVQVLFFGVIQPIVPTIVSYGLFRFELSIRLSIVLGAVGAGGIGMELYRAFSLYEYPRASMALLLILALVFLSERGATYLRKKYFS
jgi:phosphonate transport system permease protein